MYHHLFEAPRDNFPSERLDAFLEAAADGGIISVARCDPTWTIPWAALYDVYLDTGRPRELHMCEVFESQLAANKWNGDSLIERRDLLDDPARCRAQKICPLNSEKSECNSMSVWILGLPS